MEDKIRGGLIVRGLQESWPMSYVLGANYWVILHLIVEIQWRKYHMSPCLGIVNKMDLHLNNAMPQRNLTHEIVMDMLSMIVQPHWY